MSYVRISLVQPRPGRDAAVGELLDELIEYYRKQPGYIAGIRLEHDDGTRHFGRIGIWASAEDAEAAAQSEHDLALRARLQSLVDESSHVERSFEGQVSAAEMASMA